MTKKYVRCTKCGCTCGGRFIQEEGLAFGRELVKARLQKGIDDGGELKTKWVADEIGCSPSLLCHLEAGKRFPSEKMLKAFMEYYPKSAESLKSIYYGAMF